ncbi:MAG: PmoA family protein [Tannerella sp.]|jgi:hypothetical protein|nr:PmoA family protein [Tannerella sp.]
MKKFILFLVMCAGFGRAQAAEITATKSGSHIDVIIDGKFFTSYIFAEDSKYPYLFPLNGPVSGSSVTSMRNHPWPHHSSLFFGCDKVNGGNYWQEGLERGRIVSLGAQILEAKGERIVITDECIWKRPDAEAPVIDRRKITITAPSKELYQLDYDVEMEMLMDVTIEKTNHSLFSIRVDADISVDQGGTMVNSTGQQGEKETFGTASPWMDCYGTRKTGVEGIALLQHPSNPWYPSPWFTRNYGFISPTPMYWPVNEKDTNLKKGEKLSLRYRVLVHADDTQKAGIAALFEKYSKE